jgi:hypothetical protein
MPEAKKGQYAEETNSLKIAPNSFMVMYVAKDGVTKEQMRDHYQNIMLPWLKDNGVTRAKCWIVQHDGLRSMALHFNGGYFGDWSMIEGIQDLYRSHEGALMEAKLLSECYVNEV